MATFAELKNQADNTANVRKVLEGIIFMAPTSAPHIDTLTDEQGELKAIPEGYFPIGIVTPDGYSFTSETSETETSGFGYASPVRTDVESVVKGLTFNAMESFRKDVLALAYMMDLDGVTAGANGEITFDHPSIPEKQFYRAVVIGKDGVGANEVYRAKYFPRVYATSVPAEAWGSDAVSFPIELRCDIDKEIGTAVRDFIAGPGVDAEALGFATA